MKLNELTIKKASELLKSREITAVDLTKACLEKIKAVDNNIHACLTVCGTEALKAAAEADRRRANGEEGELLGIPYLAKDNLMTKDIRTTAASKMLEDYIAPYSATVIKKLDQAGAVLLGKTNLDEFAHGASTENSAFGVTHNPWDVTRVAGGSSGGSAAAVSAHMCLFALGSDTGGSIRQPASFCGVVGVKPSYGRVSRHGLMSMTSSTDVIGPLTKDVEDAAIVLKIISGADDFDSTVVKNEVDNYETKIKQNIKGLKIGLPAECFSDDLRADVKDLAMKAIKDLETLGAEIVPINLPHNKYGIPVYYIITPSEISSNLARLDGIRYGFKDESAENLINVYLKNRGYGFGPEVKRRIMVGTYALSAGYYDAYYKQAEKVRILIKKEYEDAFKEVDIIITPAAPHEAFKIGEQSSDPLKMYLEDIFVSSPSLAGLPAISVPAGFVNNLPLGIQIVGKRLGEADILRVAYNYEQFKINN